MNALKDARGLTISGLDASQLEAYENLLIQLYLYQPGVQNRLDALLAQAPDFVLGHVLRGYSIMTDGLRSGVVQASSYLQQAQRLAPARPSVNACMCGLCRLGCKATWQSAFKPWKIFWCVGP